MTTSSNHLFYFGSCFLFLIFTLILFLDFVSTTASITKEIVETDTDESALLAFKSKIIDDPQGVLKSWNDSHYFCEWQGITCSRKHRRVTVLNLRSRGLSGSLTPYIGNLSFLRSLLLQNNSIQGEIPQELGRLFRLRNLHLMNNSLVGEIPGSLSNCSRLIYLRLAGNNLIGNIPIELASLNNLKVLAIHKNKLTGGIPPFLGNITSLEDISMAYNAMGGSIPDSLGRLKNLRALRLGANNLSGTVPHSLFNFSFLEIFSLAFNQLQGNLPSNIGLTLPNLKQFQITNNSFDGKIPISLSNASKLKLIQMGINNLSGKVSVDFRGMQNLQILQLINNNLGNGEVDELNFVNSLVNCTNLQSLGISNNQFKGMLPNSIANFSNTLRELIFSTNQFYGSIPPIIDHLVNLEVMVLSGNNFSGPIPSEMGKLQNLQKLYLQDNQLSSEIPSSLGNLSLLFQLFLQNNKLSGVIPASLGNLNQLSILNLSQNELNGSIPKQIFNLSLLSVSLSLGQNHLSGSIPPEIRNLKVLTEFVVSDNNLSAEIPSEIGLCASLEYFFIEGNIFNGSIPPSLSSLRGIRKLDLSRNNFSGKIPKFLETLHLENLNLSSNNFEGEVPTKGVFANASAISVFGNNDRLCGAVIDLRLPKCPNSDSKKDNISLAFKIIISAASAIFGLTLISSLIFCWLKRRRGEKNSSFQLEKSLLKVSYKSLLKATNGFSQTHLIGVGSFGSVYKGILDEDNIVVAIKVLNLQRQGAFKSFMVECKALRNVRHRNLVRVITSCSSIDFLGNDFKAIIYQFMANGSLDTWLHPALKKEQEQLEIQSLTLLQRISIAIDVASALDYLHHNCKEPILHCDLKPSNVLLDGDMTAHVGDFGLARFQETSRPNQSTSMGLKGTIGYAAPDVMFEGDFNLHNFARTALPDRVTEIVDPVLIDEEDAASHNKTCQTRNNFRKECLTSMLRIGVACSMESPQHRMNITRVISELQSIRKILLQPTTTR